MTVENIRQEDWIVGGLALLLAITLLFFPWFSASLGAFGTVSSSGTGSPDGWLGVLAVLAAIAVLADLGIERLSPHTQIPAIGESRTMTRFVLAAFAAGCVALKFLLHIDFSGLVSFDWGFYLAAVCAGALVYFSMRARSASETNPAPVARATAACLIEAYA